MNTDTPRVRFAPSPTGYLHIGGLRTALYNYLFAKKNNGTFILRIEDTDRNRFVEGATEQLINTLKFVGLGDFEGPGNEGDCGPYVQSERLDIYHKYAKQLIESGHAYYAFDTPERLKELREYQMKNKLQPKYDKLALELSEDEVKARLKKGEPHVVRMNVEPGPKVVVRDEIRGLVEFDRDVIDDQILIKSDGFPTYHLANVVDDHLMGITHVIRGEEWISSTHKHVLLYEYLGWEKPKFAHLPLLLNPDKSKLSKRQGDVAVEDYLAKNYLPEALINFVALLGWNAGDQVEYYELDQLIEKFDLSRVQKHGAIFNVDKLKWLNSEHIQHRPMEELLTQTKNLLADTKYSAGEYSDEYLKMVIESMISRLDFVGELFTKSYYFFERPTSYDVAVVAKRWKDDSADLLTQYIADLENTGINDKHDYERALKAVAERNECGAGRIIHPIRLAVSGIGVGPGVYDVLFILGKDEVIERAKIAIEKIKKAS